MRRYVCVFCGSRPGNDPRYAAAARDAARAIVAGGFGIVYGGASVGLMGVLADEALAAGGEVVGVIPAALAVAEVAHAGLTELCVVDSMHARKALMVQRSDAFVALPGGFGTMDELCEVLTWRQLGIHDRPIGLLNTDGYYDRLLQLFDEMEARGFLTATEHSLVAVAPRMEPLLARLFPLDGT